MVPYISLIYLMNDQSLRLLQVNSASWIAFDTLQFKVAGQWFTVVLYHTNSGHTIPSVTAFYTIGDHTIPAVTTVY